MKKLLLCCVFTSTLLWLNAQVKIPGKKNTNTIGRNLLDANKNYVRSAIQFTPFSFTPDLIKKGYNASRIYTWTMPNGETKTASGTQILNEVNAMEQELNKRGHTLRDKNTFANVNFDFSKLNRRAVNPKVFRKVIQSQQPSVTHFNLPVRNISKRVRTTLPRMVDVSKIIQGDVYVYFGAINRSAEFPGTLNMQTTIDNVKNPTDCPLDVTIALETEKIKNLNISNCVLEISSNPNRSPNDNESVIAKTTFNFKNPAYSTNFKNAIKFTGDAPPSFYSLYYYPIVLKNLGNNIPKASKTEPAYYYVYLKFYNAKNELLYYNLYNTAVLSNVQMPPLQIVVSKAASGSFEDAYTDPTNLFGIYYKGNNINTKYSLMPNGWDPVEETAELSAYVEIGAQYYNFYHLLDNNQPTVNRKPFIAADMYSKYVNHYPPPQPRGIRRIISPKNEDMNSFKDYRFDYSLLDNQYSKNSSVNQSNSIGIALLPEQRFFIGPVPCKIKVDLTGTAAMSRTALMDTLVNGKVKLYAQFTPHLDLSVKGEGGVDAVIAYATIVANVNLINADMPITLNVSDVPDVDADLKINALSGQVYFKAGICVPIPFFDDVCKEFTVNIFNWTGPGKTYPLIN